MRQRIRKILPALVAILATGVVCIGLIAWYFTTSGGSSGAFSSSPMPPVFTNSPPPPAKPAAVGPSASLDQFNKVVLKYEASRFMEDAESKNAALADVATADFQKEYQIPVTPGVEKLSVVAVPDKSRVNIIDEQQIAGATYRTVVTDYYIEKRNAAGALVNVISNKPEDVTTWVQTAQGAKSNSAGWRIYKEGR